MAHIRESRPDSVVCFQGKVLKAFYVGSSSFGSVPLVPTSTHTVGFADPCIFFFGTNQELLGTNTSYRPTFRPELLFDCVADMAP